MYLTKSLEIEGDSEEEDNDEEQKDEIWIAMWTGLNFSDCLSQTSHKSWIFTLINKKLKPRLFNSMNELTLHV